MRLIRVTGCARGWECGLGAGRRAVGGRRRHRGGRRGEEGADGGGGGHVGVGGRGGATIGAVGVAVSQREGRGGGCAACPRRHPGDAGPAPGVGWGWGGTRAQGREERGSPRGCRGWLRAWVPPAARRRGCPCGPDRHPRRRSVSAASWAAAGIAIGYRAGAAAAAAAAASGSAYSSELQLAAEDPSAAAADAADADQRQPERRPGASRCRPSARHLARCGRGGGVAEVVDCASAQDKRSARREPRRRVVAASDSFM